MRHAAADGKRRQSHCRLMPSDTVKPFSSSIFLETLPPLLPNSPCIPDSPWRRALFSVLSLHATLGHPSALNPPRFHTDFLSCSPPFAPSSPPSHTSPPPPPPATSSFLQSSPRVRDASKEASHHHLRLSPHRCLTNS
jgi:hypothetical protein